MKRYLWYILLVLGLIVLSSATYFSQIFYFHRNEDTIFYLLQDVAFLPIQILLVTLIVNEILNRREKRILLKKMNMVIGVFFSEVGSGLLRHFSAFDVHVDKVKSVLLIKNNWTNKQFQGVARHFRKWDCAIDSRRGNLEGLRKFLIGKRPFLVGLLENPNLLEHETFTELLWAVFHLTEELAYRQDVVRMPDADTKHIEGDVKRAYLLLVPEWLAYVKHLRDEYPYLFSLVIRTNPFDDGASPEVK